MASKDTNLWGIHAGRSGDADTLFLKKSRIALGWTRLGDLGKLPADREAFKTAVTQAYPEKKLNSVRNNAGQLYRFVHEIKIGDLVAYPAKVNRQIHLGQIVGAYLFDPDTEPGYTHARAVKWLKSFPRSQFTQGALYELGSAMSLFLVKTFADEFRAMLEGKSEPASVVQDESVEAVTKDIEETTRDFVLKRLAQEVKGHPFAEFVAHLLTTIGYRTRVSDAGPDGGVDIVAHKDELGFEPPLIKVQVKSTEGSVGDPVVSALYGKVSAGEFGLLVTLGAFTAQARAFAKSKANLRLVDGEELVDLVFQHYEQFDSRYKGLLPLRRIYVPEVVGESDE